MPEIALLRIEIDEVTPAVIRRVEVPVTIRLDDLHFVLQIAIGWQNCHPFEFRIGDEAWGLVDRDTPETNPLPAEQATLADLAVRTSAFKYNYTFGDDWEHSVVIEAIELSATDGGIPKLLSAEGRCPPADVGGPSGYEHYLRALADPREAHHEAMVEWGDADFDPHTADIATLRGNLANLAKYLGRRKAQ
jgi:Plasmid pRiA4b ORF-3-like protein